MLGEVALLGKFSGQLSSLCFGGDFASQEKPEHALSDDLLSTRCSGKLLLAVRNGQAMEADTLYTDIRGW